MSSRVTGFLVLVGVVAQGGTLLTPEAVEKAIKKRGARPVIAELWGGDAAGARVFTTGVRNADRKWLGLARTMRLATDAGASSELDDALAVALTRAPYAVLPILREVWWQDDNARMCVFGEDSELPDGVAAYMDRLEKVMSEPPPRGGEALREACMAGLRQTRQLLTQ